MIDNYIPKRIHYCWFGGAPLPKSAENCIASWKKYCPDYEIIEWNEQNYDISSAPLYVRQAYEAKKWAFVTDYVRLKVVYDNGGIYLDTDVELVRPIDFLLENNAYFGFEGKQYIATGLGFGCIKEHPILAELMADYDSIPFISNGVQDLTACPVRNTNVFLRHGLNQDGSVQHLDNGILILSSEYLCPITTGTKKMNRTNRTVSIHWFSASWVTPEMRKVFRKRRRVNRIHNIVHFPNRALKKLLGETRYESLKNALKR